MAQSFKMEAGVYNEGNTQYEFGLFDVGRTLVFVRKTNPPGDGDVDCLAKGSGRVERDGNEFRVFVTVTGTNASCSAGEVIPLGVLPVGAYSLLTTAVRGDGSGVQQVRSAFEVKKREVVCGLTPNQTLLELAYPTADPTEFIVRYNTDAQLRHSLGDITIRSWQQRGAISVISADYAPLADTQLVLSALRGSGLFLRVGNLWQGGVCFATGCPPDNQRLSVEYYHAAFDRYFITDEPTEITKLDFPSTSGGWARTGETWEVVTSPQSNNGGSPGPGVVQQVFRFWNADASGVPSHFFTVDRQECAQLRDGDKAGWTYEGAPFWAYIPKAEACNTGVPLYRLYNNAKNGAPSHRFATRLTIVEAMEAQGWTREGVAMCVASE